MADQAFSAAPAGHASGTIVLEQDFAKLEDSIDAWEVEGDELDLYVSGEGDKNGLPGAVFVAGGDCGSRAELTHWFSGEEGARVTRLQARFVCETFDCDSAIAFTVGLAFDEDLEEAALFALTLRRPREDPGEEPPPEGRRADPIGLHMNGTKVNPNIGTLPALVEVDACLNWDKEPRQVVLCHSCRPVSDASQAASWTTTETGFYTTGVHFDSAKALSLRGDGALQVRLLDLRCETESVVPDRTK